MDERLEESFAAMEREEARARSWGWSPMLVRALHDTWLFRLRLRTGEVVQFERAEAIDAGGWWVRLWGVSFVTQFPATDDDGWYWDFSQRGLDVRVSEIVWVSDAAS